ncbi:putative F-box domain-containing protein [Rosa chinensis]|uniref:Putative F-box domain-containing protein n=1 Tax=Rosa chinensis TaxID=74649 RepID=A0A2P6P3D0_ROSCH|nr:putative F-box domain-containing protein [Rosa chinensis]
MQYLLAELISGILSWLPVKDLIRCTSVSKLWNSIVRSKLFIKEHNQRAITTNNDCTLIYISCFRDHFSSLAFSACSDTFSNEEPLKHPIYSAEERDRLGLDTMSLLLLILLDVETNRHMLTEGKGYLFLWNPMIAN